MSELGHNSGEKRLRSLIERILRLKEEQDTISEDIKEIYAEAKGEGYDKTAMGQVVAHLRKIDKKGADAVAERQTMFDLYLDAYGRATGTQIAIAHTHENSPLASADTSPVAMAKAPESPLLPLSGAPLHEAMA